VRRHRHSTREYARRRSTGGRVILLCAIDTAPQLRGLAAL
jgi:hypothetical protein